MVQLMEYDPVANHILSLSAGRVPRRQLDSIVTALLLLSSRPGDPRLAYQGLEKDRYRIDPRLVIALLTAANKKVQAAMVLSAAFWCLPKRVFRRYFFHFWRLRRRDSFWRWVLGRSLNPFLKNHPEEGHFYAKAIWTIAADPDEGIAVTGLNCAHFTGPVLTLKQAKTLIALTSRKSTKGFAAKSQLGTLYKGFDRLKPEVKSLFLDPRTLKTLRVNHDPTDNDKWGAHSWCLMNVRKVLRRHGPRRLLKLLT